MIVNLIGINFVIFIIIHDFLFLAAIIFVLHRVVKSTIDKHLLNNVNNAIRLSLQEEFRKRDEK